MSGCSACARHACACACGRAAGTPLPRYNRPGLPALRYRVGTWADFRATMETALSDANLPALGRLRTRDTSDFALALLDAWAVGADVLTFYQERIANEGFLRTAIERRSVFELARLVDYRPRAGVAASVYLAYTIAQDSPPVTIAAGARVQSVPAPGEQMQTFETAEPLDARWEWNALQPRLTRPQDLTPDRVATLDSLWVSGTTPNLKANDRLLFVFGDPAAGRTAVRRVRSVAVDPQAGRSEIALQPVDAPAAARLASPAPAAAIIDKQRTTPLQTLVDALRLPPTLQPANSVRLARDAATALGSASDTRPQLLLNFAPRLAGTFYAAWTSVAQGGPSPALSGVYALRVAAALFGYNAPPAISIQQTRNSHGGSTSTVVAGALDVQEPPDTLRLDNAYAGIVAGSHLVIEPPGAAAFTARVASAQVHPETRYGISGRTTEIALDPASLKSGPGTWQVTDEATLRATQVYAQSEPLTPAELPITDDVGAPGADRARDSVDDATHLALDGAVDGLKSGRWVVVSGQRSDVPGTDAVNAAELVMLAGVTQGADPDVPGDRVHSTLVFANAGLAYRYRRDTVTVNANVVRATHGETHNEVLGSGNGAAALPAFTLKQSPLTWVSAPTVDGVQSTLTVRVNGVAWHEIRNLALAGGDDRNYVTTTSDADKTTVRFGDGTHGARPPTGVENLTAVYRNGIGTAGNVAAGQLSLVATRPLGVKAVVNPLPATGGADAETRDQARGNVPLAVLALDRLVSVSDYADFARTFGGVGKAAAVKLGDRVQVTIAGADDAPISPTSDLYQNLLQALRDYGDPGLRVGLAVRELLALTLGANVGLAPDYAWEDVEPTLRAALLQTFGFGQRTLGQGVYLSEAVACLQAVRGVAWVDIDTLGSLDESTILAGLGGAVLGNGEGGSPAGGPPGTYVPALPALPPRYADDGKTLLGAQLLYLLHGVPDTLLLKEATP